MRQPQPLQLRIEAKEAAPPRLLDRLERRKFFEWLLGYCAAAWVVLQALDPLGDIWDWPMALQRAITLALGLGLLPAAVVAWFHGEKGRQRVCLLEVALVCASLLGAALVIGQVCR